MRTKTCSGILRTVEHHRTAVGALCAAPDLYAKGSFTRRERGDHAAWWCATSGCFTTCEAGAIGTGALSEGQALTPSDTATDLPSVFVSYGSAHQDVARELAEQLDGSGFISFFAPRDIKGSANFAVEIVKAIASSDVLVVLLDPSAVNSPHVRREVTLAIDERRLLLPVAMPGTVYPVGFSTEWMYWLSAVQVMDYRDPRSVVQRLEQLLRHESDGPRLHQRSSSTPASPRKRTQVARRPIVRGKGSPSTMLRADRAVVNIVGRDGELARLEQWCARDDDFDARVITGTAGVGKTRLALELARSLSDSGWESTFVQPSTSGLDVVLSLGGRPHLIIADYAETRAKQLGDFFEGLLDYGVENKVRLLLLARSAADWWRSLMARSAEIADLLADTTIQPLDSLTESRDRVEALYSQAIAAFSAELGVDAPMRVTPPYRTYSTILDVLEEALASVMSVASRAGGAQAHERLLSHERGYILAAAHADGIDSLDSIDLSRIAAILTLYGAADEDEATLLVGECNGDLSLPLRRKVARMFRRLYPGVDTYIQGLRPDALAENLLAQIVDDDGRLPGGPLRATQRTPEQCQHALVILARAGSRHRSMQGQLEDTVRDGDEDTLCLAMQVATQIEDPRTLLEGIAGAVEHRKDVDAQRLLTRVPDETVAMADLAAVLARRVMETLPPEVKMESRHVELAMECSNRFSDAGWAQDAVASAEVAVGRLASLVEDGDADRIVLGRALTNLSNRLWEKGNLRDSVEPAFRAVDALVVAGGEPPDEAAARNNLAFRLCEIGNGRDALDQALGALRLCEENSSENELAFSRTLGSVLNNLTCIYLASGDAESALDFGSRSVALRRSQAVSNRDRFLPYVARALVNAAAAAAACGQHVTADRFIVEARSLHAITGKKAPIFKFEEAESAAVHAIILQSRAEFGEAARAVEQSLEHLQAVSVDLGDLARRLRATLEVMVGTPPRDRHSATLDPVLLASNGIYVPHLLEYRDL